LPTPRPRARCRWVSRFNNPDNLHGQDQATRLAVSPDGSQVIVTGHSQDVTGVYGYATVDGSEAWASRYAALGAVADYSLGSTALGISPDSSRVFVTGASQDSTGDFDYATIAYETASGGVLWRKRYEGPANDYDVANALALSPDGSAVFVTGQSWSGTDCDYATIAYGAATGSSLWSKRYNGVMGGYDNARALVVSPDGTTVFVTGESWRNADTGDTDYATLAYSTTTGAWSWLKRYNGPFVQDYGRALAVSPNGRRLFVTGRSRGNSGAVSDFDYTTVAYEAN
jgi:hypothetical protein